jgi:hypothetical protein
MGMNAAAGTITQVLFIIGCTSSSYETVSPAPETALRPQELPRKEIATRQLSHAHILAPPDRAKLPDYMEVILYCKGVSAP